MFVFLFLILFKLSAQPITLIPVQLGDTLIEIRVEQKEQGEGITLIHLHQDETTALAAGRQVIQTQQGRLITLRHAGQRTIIFSLNHERFEFDPNRIFSEQGIEKTLKAHGAYNEAAKDAVNALAVQIKGLLPHGLVIALHNNRDYSIMNYLEGEADAHEAASIALKDSHQYRNFYVVTQKSDYEKLMQLSFNAVLQSPNPSDDGSLSVYLKNQPYVNVEAGFQALETQVAMIQAAYAQL